MPDIDWRDMLAEIHGRGLTYPGISHALRVGKSNIHRYVQGGPAMAITWERGQWIIRAHELLCPESFREVEPVVKQYFSTLPKG
jgi:hypothetical protein